MTALDDTMLPAVKEMIDAVGVGATLEMPFTAFNPASGMGEGQPANEVITVTPPVPVTERMIDGTTVLSTDSLVYADGYITLAPEPGATLNVAGATWRIVRVQHYYSGAAIAAWLLVIRK